LARASSEGCFPHVGVDAPDALSIALGHFDDLLPHLELLAPPLLPPVAARFADRERHLVTRPSRIGGPSKDVARHRQQGTIVVQTRARISADLGQRFAKGGERLGRDLEPENVALEVRLAPIARRVARRVT